MNRRFHLGRGSSQSGKLKNLKSPDHVSWFLFILKATRRIWISEEKATSLPSDVYYIWPPEASFKLLMVKTCPKQFSLSLQKKWPSKRWEHYAQEPWRGLSMQTYWQGSFIHFTKNLHSVWFRWPNGLLHYDTGKEVLFMRRILFNFSQYNFPSKGGYLTPQEAIQCIWPFKNNIVRPRLNLPSKLLDGFPVNFNHCLITDTQFSTDLTTRLSSEDFRCTA